MTRRPVILMASRGSPLRSPRSFGPLRRPMTTCRAYQVTGSRQFELVEREKAAPAPGQVGIRVLSCGVCHTDFLAAEGMLRGDPSAPIVPGHEIVGVIDEVGEGVTAWQAGERVGVGYLAGHCGECDFCRRGDFVNCANQHQTGTTVDGGYAEYVVAKTSGLVCLPQELDALPAAASGGGRSGRGPDQGRPPRPDLRHPHDHGQQARKGHRERGHPRVQRPPRYQAPDRNDAADAGAESLRAHDVRRSPLPRRHRLDRVSVTRARPCHAVRSQAAASAGTLPSSSGALASSTPASSGRVMLGGREDWVTAPLERAGVAVEQRAPAADRQRPPAPDSPQERALVRRFADAYEADDIDALVKLLTGDAWFAMPPVPLQYQGPPAIASFLRSSAASRGPRRFRLVPTRANTQPAFGVYLRS